MPRTVRCRTAVMHAGPRPHAPHEGSNRSFAGHQMVQTGLAIDSSAPLPITPVVVVGRYAGAVAVLAGIMASGGVEVTGTAGLDADGVDAVTALLDRLPPNGVVVVTLAPTDPCAEMALAVVRPAQVRAVTWHPADERPTLPAAVTVIAAGRIHDDLVTAVRGD